MKYLPLEFFTPEYGDKAKLVEQRTRSVIVKNMVYLEEFEDPYQEAARAHAQAIVKQHESTR